MVEESRALLPRNGDIHSRQQIENFIKSFDPKNPERTLEVIKEIWRDQGLIHPAELTKQLMNRMLDPNQPPADLKLKQEAIDKVVAASFPRESLTNSFDAKQNTPIITGLSHLYAQTIAKEKGIDVSVMEYDFGNMGATNELARSLGPTPNDPTSGWATTDKASSITANIALQTLEESFPKEKYPNFRIIAVRSGGDELRMIVAGVPLDELQQVMRDKVNSRIEDCIAKSSLSIHAHSKASQDKYRDGFGLAWGMADLGSNLPPQEIIDNAEKQIKITKLELGYARRGELPPGYREEIIERNARIKLGEGASEEAVKQLADANYREAERNVKAQKQRYDSIIPRIISAESIQNGINAPEYARYSPPEKITEIPFSNVPFRGDLLASSSEETLRQRLNTNFEQNKTSILPQEQGVFNALVQGYRAISPVTGVDLPRDLPLRAEMYAKDAQAKGEANPRIMSIEFGNTAAFNKISQNAGDKLLKEEANIIRDVLKANNLEDNDVYDLGGGKFNVLLPPMPEEKLAKVQSDIATATKLRISDVPVKEFFARRGMTVEMEDPNAKMGSVPHPKRPDVEKGVAVNIVAQTLNTTDSGSSQVDNIRKKAEIDVEAKRELANQAHRQQKQQEKINEQIRGEEKNDGGRSDSNRAADRTDRNQGGDGGQSLRGSSEISAGNTQPDYANRGEPRSNQTGADTTTTRQPALTPEAQAPIPSQPDEQRQAQAQAQAPRANPTINENERVAYNKNITAAQQQMIVENRAIGDYNRKIAEADKAEEARTKRPVDTKPAVPSNPSILEQIPAASPIDKAREIAEKNNVAINQSNSLDKRNAEIYTNNTSQLSNSSRLADAAQKTAAKPVVDNNWREEYNRRIVDANNSSINSQNSAIDAYNNKINPIETAENKRRNVTLGTQDAQRLATLDQIVAGTSIDDAKKIMAQNDADLQENKNTIKYNDKISEYNARQINASKQHLGTADIKKYNDEVDKVNGEIGKKIISVEQPNRTIAQLNQATKGAAGNPEMAYQSYEKARYMQPLPTDATIEESKITGAHNQKVHMANVAIDQFNAGVTSRNAKLPNDPDGKLAVVPKANVDNAIKTLDASTEKLSEDVKAKAKAQPEPRPVAPSPKADNNPTRAGADNNPTRAGADNNPTRLSTAQPEASRTTNSMDDAVLRGSRNGAALSNIANIAMNGVSIRDRLSKIEGMDSKQQALVGFGLSLDTADIALMAASGMIKNETAIAVFQKAGLPIAVATTVIDMGLAVYQGNNRGAFQAAAGLAGGLAGGALAGAATAPGGPLAVAASLGGAVVGNIAAREAAGVIYDVMITENKGPSDPKFWSKLAEKNPEIVAGMDLEKLRASGQLNAEQLKIAREIQRELVDKGYAAPGVFDPNSKQPTLRPFERSRMVSEIPINKHGEERIEVASNLIEQAPADNIQLTNAQDQALAAIRGTLKSSVLLSSNETIISANANMPNNKQQEASIRSV